MSRRKNGKISKNVKLDITGVTKFKKKFGLRGTRFRTGLWQRKQASKGYALEYGDWDNNQPARPWLSQIFKGKTGDRINKTIKLYVEETLEGDGNRKRTEQEITQIVQDHLNEQLFSAEPLKWYTRVRKSKAGMSRPSAIGIATGDMMNAIRTKSTTKIKGD